MRPFSPAPRQLASQCVTSARPGTGGAPAAATSSRADPGRRLPLVPTPGKPPRRHDHPTRTYRVPWADLLRKVFSVDVLLCPDCGGRLWVLAFIIEAAVARRILDCLGLDSSPPPVARAQAPAQGVGPSAPTRGAARPRPAVGGVLRLLAHGPSWVPFDFDEPPDLGCGVWDFRRPRYGPRSEWAMGTKVVARMVDGAWVAPDQHGFTVVAAGQTCADRPDPTVGGVVQVAISW